MNQCSLFFYLVRAGFRRALAQRELLAGKVFFLFVILAVFTFVWRAVVGSGFKSSVSSESYVWYLLVGELSLLTVPNIFREMRDEIQSGDVIGKVLRPVWYPIYALGDVIGGTLGSLAVMAPCGALFVFFVSGGGPDDSMGFIASLLLAPLAASIVACLYVLIGLLALWLVDVSAIQWIVSKSFFVFGGLLVPLHLYPDWFHWSAKFTPFYPAVYGNARQVFGFSGAWLMRECLLLHLWLGLILFAIWAVNRKLIRVLNVGGG